MPPAEVSVRRQIELYTSRVFGFKILLPRELGRGGTPTAPFAADQPSDLSPSFRARMKGTNDRLIQIVKSLSYDDICSAGARQALLFADFIKFKLTADSSRQSWAMQTAFLLSSSFCDVLSYFVKKERGGVSNSHFPQLSHH